MYRSSIFLGSPPPDKMIPLGDICLIYFKISTEFVGTGTGIYPSLKIKEVNLTSKLSLSSLNFPIFSNLCVIRIFSF